MGLYKQLIFGISCAPEMFQRIIRSVLKGYEGTINFIDDILVLVLAVNQKRNTIIG